MSPVGHILYAVAILVSGIVATRAPRAENHDRARFNVTRIINRDVVIVGGGASGAHAAVKLSDMGKTVAVVEKQNQLGGSTETYWDPVTRKPLNVGVQAWVAYKNATEFITDRMNVSIAEFHEAPTTTKYIDFSTGAELENYIAPTSDEIRAALETYVAVCKKYEDLILPGYFDFPEDDIPEDLTMLFKDFVAKYNITAAVPRLFGLTGLGTGDIMNTVTMYVMQATGAPFVSAILGEVASILPASGDAHELYDKISDFLGDNVLYDTIVISSIRGNSNSGVQLITQDSAGCRTLIHAKRLLLAIEPTKENMEPFDVDKTEAGVFGKFQQSHLYVGFVKHPSLPINVSLTNTPTSAAPSNWTDQVRPSFNSGFDYFGHDSDLFRFLAVGTADLDVKGARELVFEGFNKMVDSGVLGQVNDSCLEFVAFEDHGPMHLRVDAGDLKAGFIQDLYALQGRRSTWFTGAAWSAQFTTILWAYNDMLLPKMIQSIEGV